MQDGMPAPPPFGPGLAFRSIRIADAQVVWLRSIVEAYDGLGLVYGDGEGRLSICTTEARASELDDLLDDLSREVSLERLDADGERGCNPAG